MGKPHHDAEIEADFEEVADARRADRRQSDRRVMRQRFDALFAASLINQMEGEAPRAPRATAYATSRAACGRRVNVRT
jgi:hypothetical protein